MTIEVPETIKRRLKDARITEAAIIDETFDGISNEVLKTDLPAFLDALQEPAVFEEVKAICPRLEDAEEFDLDRAKELWAAHEQWGANLKPKADGLFNTYVQRLTTLDTLASHLRQLELQVHRLGANQDIPKTVSLVFLDYHLEPEKDIQLAEAMVQQIQRRGISDPTNTPELLAERIAKKLAAWVECPFLVLISEKTDAETVREDFRRRTNYLGGTFACLKKTKASNQEDLYFHLGCWGLGHPALGATRKFFDAVVHSIDKSAAEFKESLLALDAQDYSFIQRLSLSSDGEPLGEYMLELIGAALSHRLRSQQKIFDAKKILDEQHFQVHPPSLTQPSSELRRLYQHATTEPNVGDLAPHPLHKLQTPAPASPMPRLVLGDVLAKRGSEVVYMVINAGCDLQFSPVNSGRHADPDLPIYLLPGKLEPLSNSTADPAAKRTELFEFENRAYRIVWDQKHAITINWKEVQKWCQDGQYCRVGRLGAVYALSMQQVWTSGLGRVGVMVTPPFTESADLQIYLQDAQGKLEPFGTRVRGQVILGSFRRKNEDVDWFLLTKDGMESLHTALKVAPSRFESFTQAVPSGPNQAGKMGNLRKLGGDALKATGNWDPWFQLLEREQELPRRNGSKLNLAGQNQIPVTFSWQCYPAGDWVKSFGSAQMVVDILRPEAPDTKPVPTQHGGTEPPTGAEARESVNASQPSQSPPETGFSILQKMLNKMMAPLRFLRAMTNRVRH